MLAPTSSIGVGSFALANIATFAEGGIAQGKGIWVFPKWIADGAGTGVGEFNGFANDLNHVIGSPTLRMLGILQVPKLKLPSSPWT